MRKTTKNFIRGSIIGFFIGFIPHGLLLPIFEYLKFKTTDIIPLITSGVVVGLLSSLVMGILFYSYLNNKKFFIISLIIAFALYVILIVYTYAFYSLVLSEFYFGGPFG